MTVLTTKVDIKMHGKSHSVRLPTPVWTAFRDLADARKVPLSALADEARREHNGSLAEAIIAYVNKHCGELPLYATCQTWFDAAVELFRPIFAARGFPLPAKITTKLAFPSTGWKGKRIGEWWAPTMGKDQTTHTIFVHPCMTDARRILSTFTHELCHAADYVRNGNKPVKQGHGKHFATIGEALNLEGKPKVMEGRDAWWAWASEIADALGPVPHNPLAEAVKKEKAQTNRHLKFAHEGCPDAQDEKGTIWRMSAGAVATKRNVLCPCCGAPVPNEHFEEDAADDLDTDLEDDGNLDAPDQETAHRPRKPDLDDLEQDEDAFRRSVTRRMRKNLRKVVAEQDTRPPSLENTENRLRGGRNHFGDVVETK